MVFGVILLFLITGIIIGVAKLFLNLKDIVTVGTITQPAIMRGVLGVVYRAIATHLIHKAGYTQKSAHTGAVTLIQRFGSALNLNKQT